MKLDMVSENLFNEVLLSNEQKSLTRIFKTGPNLDEKSRQLQMSKVDVDIPKPSAFLDENSETSKDYTPNCNALKTEPDYLTSDIELSIDDYEERDNSKTETSTINIKTNGLPPKNDVDSIESIDHDLKTTANLVGKQFLQDDFDSNDSLDIESISRLNKSLPNSNHNTGAESELIEVDPPDVQPKLCNNVQKTVSSDNCANQLLPNLDVDRIEVGEKSIDKVDKNSETNGIKIEPIENNQNTTEVKFSESDENRISHIKRETEEAPSGDNVEQALNNGPANCDEPADKDSKTAIFNKTSISDAESTKQIVNPVETNLASVDEISKSNENREKSPIPCESAVPSVKNNEIGESENTSEPSSSASLEKSAESYLENISSMEIENPVEQPKLTESVSAQNEEPISVVENSTSQSERKESSETSTIPEVDESSSPLNSEKSTDSEIREINLQIEPEKSTLPVIEKMTQPDCEKSSVPEIKETNSQLENKESTVLETPENNSHPEHEKITVLETLEVNPSSEREETGLLEKRKADAQPEREESNLRPISIVDSNDERIENESGVSFIEDSTPNAPTMSTSEVPEIASNVNTTSANDMDVDCGQILKKNVEPISHMVNSIGSDDDCAILHCSEPKSVESTELQIIDLADPEVVDLEDSEELTEIDRVPKTNQIHVEKQKLPESSLTDTIDITALEEPCQKEDNQVHSVEEIHDTSINHETDDIMEVDSTEIEIPVTVHSGSRKRRIDSKNSSNPGTEEKRRKSTDETQSKTISSSPEVKKKSTMNIARKHTSSSNVSKTVREIEKKISEDLTRINEKARSREPTPSSDTIDEYDIIINNDKNSNAADENELTANYSQRIVLKSNVLSKESLNSIFEVMKERLTRRQLEEIVIQKCCEMISDSSEIGALRKQVYDLQQTETFRKQKMLLLEKQIHQLKAVCQKYLEQVKDPKTENKVCPIKVTRSVGLQVAIESTAVVDFPEISVSQRSENRLKKLLTISPASGSLTKNLESLGSAKNGITIPSGSKSNDAKASSSFNDVNGRVTSPLASISPVPSSGRNAAAKNIVTPTETVIDLTDKDDKIENEAQTAAKNIMRNVNGSLVTYVPVKMNHDQHKQILKPGTQLLVNGQLVTVRGKTYQDNIHPAPIPPTPPVVAQPDVPPLPPKPILKVAKNGNGIMVSWNMPQNISYATITKYQLYAYQETSVPPSEDLWKFVGDVHALALPMACTLTQFVEGYRYHFIVRAVDKYRRMGPFSGAESISL